MSHISVSELEYAPPGSDSLFFDVTFTVAPGEHAALIGVNGVGKSTILRILGGELEPDEGSFSVGGTVLRMTQDVGMASPGTTLRELLIEVAAPALRAAGRTLVEAERAMYTGEDDGTQFASALADWGDLGGYELEGRWAAAAERSVKTPVTDFAARTVGELSGGERKRLVLDVLFSSGADVLLLDEPDNYLDVPTRSWLEQQIRACQSTVLMVSHDRTLLANTATKIVCVEGSGAWVHGGSYAGFGEARAKRQEQLGDDLKRWNDEERRLFHHMKIMKQRAAQNFKNATKANAAETRWEKFVKAGPPPPPVADQHILVKLRGADAARRVVQLTDVSIDGHGDEPPGEATVDDGNGPSGPGAQARALRPLILPFSHTVYHGERVGLIGPNGTGKTHLLASLAGTLGHGRQNGEIKFGPRTSVGMFTQVNDRPEFRGRTALDIVRDRRYEEEQAMKSLARYRLGQHARQEFATLSGGQKARLEILCLELDGHNVLLLDEPTDNLDVDSAEALEQALDGFEGTVIAVSHDRTFLSQLDRFVMITDDGAVLAIPDYELAVQALADPARAGALRLVETLT